MAIFPSVFRQRSLTSSRMSSGDSPPEVFSTPRGAALAEVARLLEVLDVDSADERGVLLAELGLRVEQAVDDPVDVLRDGALLRAGRLRQLLRQRRERLADLDRRVGDGLQLARGELAVVTDRSVADELADLLRVLGRDLRRDLDEQAADQRAGVLERREQLLLGPVGQPAGPEVVVLVEVLLLALGEIVAAPLQAALERGELLVAVDVDPLGLRLHLVLEVVDVLRARLVVDRGDDRGCEVQDLFQLTRARCRAGNRCGSARP